MKMANFLMPKNTPVTEVRDEAHPGADVTRMGAVDVARGPIGDIAAADDGTIVVTNHGDDTVSLLAPGTLAVAGAVAVPGDWRCAQYRRLVRRVRGSTFGPILSCAN